MSRISMTIIRDSPSITGNLALFYQGTSVPSLSQPTAAPYQVSSYSSLVPSPVVPTPPHGCGYLLIAHQDQLTDLLSLAPSLSPKSYAVPTIPTLDEYPKPQATTTPGGLGFGFPVAAETHSLPLADPPLAYDPTWEECKLTSSHAPNPARILTTRDIVWSQFPTPNPLPPSGSVAVAVSGSIVPVVLFIYTIL